MIRLPIFSKGRSGGMNFTPNRKISSHIFLYGYIFLIFGLFFIIVLRLFQLTVVKGEYFRRLSEQNRIRELIIEPKRGTIVDRKGLLIAENSPADIKKIAERVSSARTYTNQEALAPIIGYRQKADKNDIKNDPCVYKLNLGDKVGKKGVEKIFDCDLRGRNGKKLIEVDAKGNYVRTLSLLPPVDGQTIKLSLDLKLQKKAYNLIKGKKGAIIATNPQTGEILALASSPSFNPQDFEDENDKALSSYFNDKDKPLFNRATEATYPPGSIFKLVLATGALEDKKIDEKTLIEDTGILHAGPLTFGNWYYLQYGKTEGMIDIVKAIQRSNDIFFYQVGDLLTPNRISYWAEILGYGKATTSGLDDADGLVPSEFWKEEVIKEQWYTGDTYNLSIGQGYLLVTPIQVNDVTSVFANKGYLCQPQLTRSVILSERSESKDPLTNRPNCKKLPISDKTISLIREGMKEACSTGGTGWPLFDFKPQTACKTGTAESQSKEKNPHAWITVFAPFDNPQIALTILIEEGGEGSSVAGPLAKELLKTYFGQ